MVGRQAKCANLRGALGSRNVRSRRFAMGKASGAAKWVSVFWSFKSAALRASFVQPHIVPSLSKRGPHQRAEGSRLIVDMVLQWLLQFDRRI